MRKIIFLDIDGVLATEEDCDETKLWGLSAKKQELLGQILDSTNAEIVLSSSWRSNDIETTKTDMTSKGFLFSDKIIGVTIRAYHYIDKSTKIHLFIPRGVEIKQWLDTNIHGNIDLKYQRKILNVDYTYVILDDDSDMLLEQANNFLKCNSKKGLTAEIVDEAISILNKNS